jgi:hypothetical protein
VTSFAQGYVAAMLLLLVLCMLGACTNVTVDVIKPDGTHVTGTYFSTKTQINPHFKLDKGDSISVEIGTEQSKGVEPQQVIDLVNAVSDVLKPAP